jgi:GntR family transcriptional regulator
VADEHTTDITPAQLIERLTVTLAPSRRTPLYEQLAHGIRQAIQRGDLAPGTMLPPEPDLAAYLGVSRQTVNHALTSLARHGHVMRRRGVGTVVVAPFIEQPLNELYSFVRTLNGQGRAASTRPLGYRITVDDVASPLLTEADDGLVLELSRLRLLDAEPFVVETTYLPLACAERIPPDRLAQEVLYDLLKEYCQIAITHAEETLRPITMVQRDAALLGLRAGDAAFLVERTSYAATQPIELRFSLIRGDRLRFRVHLEAANRTLSAD